MVLENVSLSLHPGEIMALVGHNGSGKSTLIKCLAGYHRPESGAEFWVNGHNIKGHLNLTQVGHLGLRFIHQDLGLLPNATVCDNLYLSNWCTERHFYIHSGDVRRRAASTLKAFGLEIDVMDKVATLSPMEQATLAIARMLSSVNPETVGLEGVNDNQENLHPIIVLDEVTTFFDDDSRDSLGHVLRSVVESGASVLLVSHNTQEVLEIADTVTVLRNGRLVATCATSDATQEQLTEFIVGYSSQNYANAGKQVEARQARGGVELEVRDLSSGAVQQFSLSLRSGEIVGLTGISGAGWEGVPEALFGAQPASGGTIQLRDRAGIEIDLHEMQPHVALDLGMVLVPGDRLKFGLAAKVSVTENILLPRFDKGGRGLRLRWRNLTRWCSELIQLNAVRPSDPKVLMGTLSGGNQQKVLMAKWISTDPRVLLLSEPTQGVDVGSRAHIHEMIRGACSRGLAVLYAGADWHEIVGVADRVLVMAGGRIVGEVPAQAEDMSAAVAVVAKLALEDKGNRVHFENIADRIPSHSGGTLTDEVL
jgi:ribose transport system ATP-binding protein